MEEIDRLWHFIKSNFVNVCGRKRKFVVVLILGGNVHLGGKGQGVETTSGNLNLFLFNK